LSGLTFSLGSNDIVKEDPKENKIFSKQQKKVIKMSEKAAVLSCCS
jgi:hypothetical protein